MSSTGVRTVDTSEFDTIRFQWNGQRQARVYIRLNCLSTEFSRIKGVKGIQLRYATARPPGAPPRRLRDWRERGGGGKRSLVGRAQLNSPDSLARVAVMRRRMPRQCPSRV